MLVALFYFSVLKYLFLIHSYRICKIYKFYCQTLPGNPLGECCLLKFDRDIWTHTCKKYIENLECRCRPECTNYHPDICKYSVQFRKCYNVRCYRIHRKGTMRKRSPQEQHQAPSHLQTNQFQKPYRPAYSAFANKPQETPVSLTLIILSSHLSITTLTPITQFIPTPTLGPRALPAQTQSNPYHQDTISVGNTLLHNHPPTLHNTTARMISQLQKSNLIHMIIFLFYTKK